MVKNRVGPPVRGEDFYGREALVELVWQKLDLGHLLLAAPRRFGKTSVMYRLIDAPREDYRIVHADLQHLTEPAELLTQLVGELARDDRFAKTVSSLSYFPTTLWSRFRRNFDEVEFLSLKVKLREQLRPRWQESGEELFRRLAGSEQPVVFILDEFPMMIDRMERSDAHREEARTLLRWLRALRLSPSAPNVRFIIAGSIGIDHVLSRLGEIASINDFEKIRLDPFSPRVAAGLLDELASGQGISLSPASRRKMLELIGILVPYFIQVVFSEVIKAHMQDGEPITPRRVEQVYHDRVLGVDCKTYFEHYYGRLREYYRPHEERATKRMLRELARSGSLTRDLCYQIYREQLGSEAELESFNALMAHLENDFYVTFDRNHEQYEFSCKLLRDWWLRHYAMAAE